MALEILFILGCFVICYLIGALMPAYFVGRFFFNVDIRTQGSGNVGGANSARLFGKKFGIVVGLFDLFKGTFAIFLAKYISQNYALNTGFFSVSSNIIAISGFLAVIGHCYPFYLHFHGGKGGATSGGVVLGLNWLAFVILIVFWLLIVGTTRFTSLGNLLGVITIPFLLFFTTNELSYLYMGIVLIFLIYYTHRANVRRLLKGEERKFGQKEAIKSSES